MPAIKDPDHVHQYERVGTQQNQKWWRCAHPDCTHRLPTFEILGKRSQCKCGATFIIDAGAKQRKRPLCLNCRGTREGRQHQEVTKLLDDLIEQGARTDG